MMKVLLGFAAGWFFGRNPQAAGQVVQTVTDAAQTFVPQAQGNQPTTYAMPNNVAVDVTLACPPGQVLWTGGQLAGAYCTDAKEAYRSAPNGEGTLWFRTKQK